MSKDFHTLSYKSFTRFTKL